MKQQKYINFLIFYSCLLILYAFQQDVFYYFNFFLIYLKIGLLIGLIFPVFLILLLHAAMAWSAIWILSRIYKKCAIVLISPLIGLLFAIFFFYIIPSLIIPGLDNLIRFYCFKGVESADFGGHLMARECMINTSEAGWVLLGGLFLIFISNLDIIMPFKGIKKHFEKHHITKV